MAVTIFSEEGSIFYTKCERSRHPHPHHHQKFRFPYSDDNGGGSSSHGQLLKPHFGLRSCSNSIQRHAIHLKSTFTLQSTDRTIEAIYVFLSKYKDYSIKPVILSMDCSTTPSVRSNKFFHTTTNEQSTKSSFNGKAKSIGGEKSVILLKIIKTKRYNSYVVSEDG